MALRPRIPPSMFSTYVAYCREHGRDRLFRTDLDFPDYILTVPGFLFGMVINAVLSYVNACTLTSLLSCSCFGGMTS